ncbi:MAG: rhomboid family intramembrane serine protease [Syntrophotaleaceae bacterium]
MDWKAFFDRLGLDGTRWQWRIMRWERNMKTFFKQGTLPGGESLNATKIILALNLIWFSLMILKGAAAGLGLTPLMAPRIELLLHFGAQLWVPLVLNDGQWWRCLTYAYTHAGLIHLGFNMLVLYQVGPLIEREIGTPPFITLYTLTALTATLLGFFWHPGTPVVGASGSIFGLIGFAVAYFHRMGPVGQALRNFMFRWAVFAFIFGLLVGADNAGHLGGALGGAAFGLLLPMSFRGRQASAKLFLSLAVLCAGATIGSLGWQVVYWFI